MALISSARLTPAALLAALALATPALAQGGAPTSPPDPDGDGVTSIAEFKAYVAQRAAGIPQDMVDQIAERVDKDGDGEISRAEFADRMTAFREVTSGQRRPGAAPPPPPPPPPPPAPPAADMPDAPADYLDGAPARVDALTASDNATLLLITGDELAEAWVPYASWKTRQGKATKLITVRQIARSYEADSIQEKIRLCVRDHIDNHATKWVVLGGDCLPNGGLVPGGHRTVHAQERAGIPTDIVYLSDTNWDADGDGIYGEFDDDRDAITYPDGSVGLGRIPVRTAADVAAFTEKVIAYESAYPTDEFASQMVYTCTDSPAYPKVRASWDRYLSKNWDGSVQRFFSQETPWDDEGKPGSYDLTDSNLVSLINQRTTGKLHIHGHGLLRLWVLEDSTFDAKDVGKLDNNGAYPLITTVSCFTGQYDAPQDPSIVESMLREPEAGSVAIVAPVRTGKPHFHSRSDFALMVSEGKLDGTTMTMTKYWSNGLGDGLTTGESLMKTKDDLAEDARKSAAFHLCLCELNLLGDPTLDMRAATPRTPTLDVPKSINRGHDHLIIDTDAPGATLCVWKGHEVYEVVTADDRGHASIGVDADTRGELFVTVSGPNLNTVTTSVQVR